MWNRIKQRWLLADRLIKLSRQLESEIEALYNQKKQTKSYVEISPIELQGLKSKFDIIDKYYNHALNEALSKLRLLDFSFANIAEGLLIIRIKE